MDERKPDICPTRRNRQNKDEKIMKEKKLKCVIVYGQN